MEISWTISLVTYKKNYLMEQVGHGKMGLELAHGISNINESHPFVIIELHRGEKVLKG
jgi:hypothetical protein